MKNRKPQTANRKPQTANRKPQTANRKLNYFSAYSRFRILSLFIFFSITVHNLCAQHYTKFYDQNVVGAFDQPESYIIQRFYPSTQYNFDGTIMIKNFDAIVDRPIEITLVDNDGIKIKSQVCFHFPSAAPFPLLTFVPTAAAFNSVTKQYAIVGIKRTSYASPPLLYDSWILVLDEDLNLLYSEYINGTVLNVLTGGSSLFVTDVCSIEGGIVQDGFALTGLLSNTIDPTPNSNSTLNKLLTGVRTYYDVTSATLMFADWTYYDYGTNEFNNCFFPSRIIELPLGATDGGFIITGTGPIDASATDIGSVFFARTDYNMSMNTVTNFYSPTNNELIAAGDLYYDAPTQEVWFAGTCEKNSYPHYMVQKLIDLNNPALQIYPDLDMNGANPTPYNFGLYKLFSETGKFKISKIMPCNTTGTGVIGSYFFECPYYHYMSSTNSFPMLMKSDYSDGQLMEFATTSPSPTVHSYPRIMGNVGLGNEYNFLDYLNRWYPSHTAHHMPLNTYPDESYIMGSTLKHALMPTGYPEFNILMRTENYNFLRCITFEEQTQNDFITTDFFSVLPSSNSYFFINHQPFDTLT